MFYCTNIKFLTAYSRNNQKVEQRIFPLIKRHASNHNGIPNFCLLLTQFYIKVAKIAFYRKKKKKIRAIYKTDLLHTI